ncbi:Alanine dehydrogenase [compost metagenome]
MQARSHLQTFSEMFPLESVKVFGRGPKNIGALWETAQKLGLSTEVCKSPQEAVEGVDLVVSSVTHTGVTEPFLDANWLSNGCFAAIADLAVPWHKESFAAFNPLVIDDRAQEASLPNKLADPGHIHGDLSDLIAGRIHGRRAEDERTAFVFRGHALGDLALAALAYQKHVQA